MIIHQFFRRLNTNRSFDWRAAASEKRTLEIKPDMHHNIDLLIISGKEEDNPFVSLRLSFPMRII
jgi:hypothetical protein